MAYDIENSPEPWLLWFSSPPVNLPPGVSQDTSEMLQRASPVNGRLVQEFPKPECLGHEPEPTGIAPPDNEATFLLSCPSNEEVDRMIQAALEEAIHAPPIQEDPSAWFLWKDTQ